MKYYEEHHGQATLEELLNFPYRKQLLEALPATRTTALDLGCGTGPIALTLAQLGFEVTGIDASPTAVNRAFAHAQELNLNATFICDDFLTVKLPPQDLIVDSSFLHCLVYDEDRAGALGKIRDLKPQTVIVHTMVSDRAFDLGPKFEFDRQGFLYYRGAEGRVPQRRILPKDKIVQEFTQRGFRLALSELLYAEQVNNPLTLFAVFRA